MDILYQLSFPDEVCSKIFMYACKSPHNGLGSAALKHIIGFDIYNKLIKNGGIVLDGDGHVVEILVSTTLSFEERREQLTFDIEHLKSLQNLTYINLIGTVHVSGNIVHLKSLQNLTAIYLRFTGVTGNIVHLKSLQKLTVISLSYSGVTGNIVHLKSLQDLSEIYIYNTRITGDIIDLKSLPDIFEISIADTEITVNEELFDEYRESVGLGDCIINI